MRRYATLHTHSESGILTITMNRPDKRNALNPEMMEDLTHAFISAGDDPCCRVVMLTGAGSAFCAGLDLDHLETLRAKTPEEHRIDSARIARLLRTLYDLPKPTIAAVNGAAIAGGMGLATICDFTLAIPEAKFGYTEVQIGFVPAIVSAFLRGQVGDKRSRDLLLTGRLIRLQRRSIWEWLPASFRNRILWLRRDDWPTRCFATALRRCRRQSGCSVSTRITTSTRKPNQPSQPMPRREPQKISRKEFALFSRSVSLNGLRCRWRKLQPVDEGRQGREIVGRESEVAEGRDGRACQRKLNIRRTRPNSSSFPREPAIRNSLSV